MEADEAGYGDAYPQRQKQDDDVFTQQNIVSKKKLGLWLW